MTIETTEQAVEAAVTKYLPSRWLDEIVPEPQRDVNDFIHRAEGGAFLLLPVDESDREDFYREPLEPGKVVPFSIHEDYGTWTIRVNDDRSFDAAGVPAKATHFIVCGDIDTLAYSLDELVGNKDDREPLPAGEHEVDAYYWSDEDVNFRFVIDADGTARFERCAGAN